MAFNLEEAIPAFNEATRTAFAAYLEVNEHRYQITDSTYEQYITYLTNALYEPSSRADQAKRAFVKTSFQMDEGGYALQACATERHKQARLVIMQSSIFDIIQEEHCRIGHAGVHPTWAAVSQGYYGIIRTEIIWLLKRCQICIRRARNRSRGPLIPIVTTKLFERIQVDLIDFRNEPDNIYHWILHIKDHFSKYCQLYPLANKEAKTVANAMTYWLSAFGPPSIVQSDNGREFKGAFKELLLRYGIRIINGRPRTPRTQGLVEQANGIVKQKIIAWKRENGVPGWATALPAVALQINRTVQRANKKTPYEVVFGQEMRREERVPIRARAAMPILDEDLLQEEDLAEPSENEELTTQIMSELEEEDGLQESLDQTLESSESEAAVQQSLTIRQQQKNTCNAEVRVNQSQAAAVMVTKYSKRHDIQVFSAGDLVSIAIPRLDRGPLDDRRVLGRIRSVPREDKYEVETLHGIVETLLPTSELLPIPSEIQFVLPPGQANKVSLHHIAAQEAASDVVQTSCNCKKLCKSRRCACRNAGLKCSVACHADEHDCQNMLPIAQRTEKGLRQRSKKRVKFTKGARAGDA